MTLYCRSPQLPWSRVIRFQMSAIASRGVALAVVASHRPTRLRWQCSQCSQCSSIKRTALQSRLSSGPVMPQVAAVLGSLTLSTANEGALLRACCSERLNVCFFTANGFATVVFGGTKNSLWLIARHSGAYRRAMHGCHRRDSRCDELRAASRWDDLRLSLIVPKSRERCSGDRAFPYRELP